MCAYVCIRQLRLQAPGESTHTYCVVEVHLHPDLWYSTVITLYLLDRLALATPLHDCCCSRVASLGGRSESIYVPYLIMYHTILANPKAGRPSVFLLKEALSIHGQCDRETMHV